MEIEEYDSHTKALVRWGRRLAGSSTDGIAPRNMPIQEATGVVFRICAAGIDWPDLIGRRFSPYYAVGELCWYWAGSRSLDFIKFYAPSYDRFSDDGRTSYGAYGPRLRPQMEAVKDLLSKDHDSRQAVVMIRSPDDIYVTTKDQPCTLALQFLVRAYHLHLIATMRSEDWWFGGFYDPWVFRMLQCAMANELGVTPGYYQHQVGSLHVYRSDLAKVRTAVVNPPLPQVMNQYPSFGFDDLDDLVQFAYTIQGRVKGEQGLTAKMGQFTERFKRDQVDRTLFDCALLLNVHCLRRDGDSLFSDHFTSMLSAPTRRAVHRGGKVKPVR